MGIKKVTALYLLGLAWATQGWGSCGDAGDVTIVFESQGQLHSKCKTLFAKHVNNVLM